MSCANIKNLLYEYKIKKAGITARLKSFKRPLPLTPKQAFEELAFCIFTPGSKALNGARAVKKLKAKGLLFTGSRVRIAANINGIVRFHNNKALYLTLARNVFVKKSGSGFKNIFNAANPREARQWLVSNIKGIGYKEASHFLRNVGLGRDLAILDTHILKNLKRLNIIKEIPRSISKKTYLFLEGRMRRFSETVHIPLDELDLLFWSRETGFIFK
ncbi:MAG: N-glycosylase/DNA lyase [Candidatus Omnitrophica bacterium]|nr:N-glycosylase/DNA lyase [Candidatus Omnitrophota bacterium]